MEECWGSNYLLFTYDEQGRPYSVNYNGGQYFYVLNQQGDVIRIVAGDGSIRAEYRYNAWGEVEETENSAWLGKINPLRCRGYYYDAETGLYYLNSRYYDPSIGRFINSDTTDVLMSSLESLADKNFFSYCDNNPVVRRDAQGNAWETVFDIISLGASITEVAVNPTDPWAWLGLVGDVVDVAVPFVGGIGEATKTLKQVANATIM